MGQECSAASELADGHGLHRHRHLMQHSCQRPYHPSTLHRWLRSLEEVRTWRSKAPLSPMPLSLGFLAARIHGSMTKISVPEQSHFHRHSWFCAHPSQCCFKDQSDFSCDIRNRLSSSNATLILSMCRGTSGNLEPRHFVCVE